MAYLLTSVRAVSAFEPSTKLTARVRFIKRITNRVDSFCAVASMFGLLFDVFEAAVWTAKAVLFFDIRICVLFLQIEPILNTFQMGYDLARLAHPDLRIERY